MTAVGVSAPSATAWRFCRSRSARFRADSCAVKSGFVSCCAVRHFFRDAQALARRQAGLAQ
ncbi:MAG: hypothetical protein A3K18_00140 [Lentisphaerae bacterium RIFOXYA12_64_32]|nr:MAG: hypothetical protein A3K18_00140 [Lentisphaerae bacterium RIFOXYA12_64_32]